MRVSLALAAGGTLFLMSGIVLMLTSAALRLEHQAHPVPLVAPGAALAVVGLALGASALVTTLLDVPSRMPPVPGSGGAGRAAAPARPVPYGRTVLGEVLFSFVLPGQRTASPVAPPEVVPGVPLVPPGRPAAVPVPAARAPLPAEMLASEVLAGYSDGGWGLDAASADGPSAQPPAEEGAPLGGR